MTQSGVPRRRAVLGFLLLLAAVAGVTPGAAQEAQLPFDSQGRIEVVDAETARRTGVFVDEYPGFVEARLFQAVDASVALEVLVRRDGRIERTRVPLSPAQLADLRARFSQGVAPAAGDRPERDARFRLLAGTSALGFLLYGPAVPIAMNLDGDQKEFVALYMLTAGTSFFVPWMLTQNQTVTPAMAQLAFYGGSRGFLHGGALHYLLTGPGDAPQPVCDEFGCYEEDEIKRGAWAFGIVTGVAEGVAGYLWAKRAGLTGGESNAIATGGDWGILNGFGAAVLLGIDLEDEERGSTALMLGGAAGGLVAGRAIGERRDFSYGDVEIASTTGWLGALSALTAVDLLGLEDEKVAVASAMAGGLAGLVAGDALVRQTDFSNGQATLVRLGTLAGGLMGLGLGVLAAPEDGDGTVMATATTAGALAGFGLTYRTVKPSALAGSRDGSSLEFQLNPQGLVAAASGGTVLGGGRAPLMNLRMTF